MGYINNSLLKRATTDKTTVNTASYSASPVTEEIVSHDVAVRYQVMADTEQSATDSLNNNQYPWQFYLTNNSPVVPGSVVLSISGELFFDDGDGRIVRNFNTSTGVGIPIGTIDYSSSRVSINNYTGRPLTASVATVACLTGEDWSVLGSASFRTAAAPIRPNGFTVRADNPSTGVQYNAAADSQGALSGDGVTGEIDLQKGLADIVFPQPVLANSVFYNAVSYKQIPLDPSILGLDPVRLPGDGRVPIIRDADIVVLTHTAKDLIASPAAGMTINAGRDKLYSAWIEDSEGTQLDPAQYSINKDTGIGVLADPFTAQDADSNALVGDLFLVHRIDDMAMCTEARIDGTLQLAQPLYHAFPANETWVASAVYLGGLRGRVKDFGCYATDPGYGLTGTPSNAQYNLINYPVAIDNRGSVPERWKIIFTSTTAFRLLGEHRGQVATGSIAVDFSPLNPQSGTPFFSIESDGWGSGWQTGNTVVFETEAAAAPLWLIRTVLPGQATVDDDLLKIELRGDHN